MDKVKAALFDMDGTLIDASEWHYEALNSALGVFGFSISLNQQKNQFNGLSTRKKLEILTKENKLPRDLHDIISDVKQDRTIRIAATKCFPIVSIQILLSRLKMSGIKLAVVTNSIRETAEFMLKYSGIIHYFDLIITNEDVVNQKPSPDCYLQAMSRLNVEPDSVVVIEDGVYGIESAQSAGIENIIKVSSPRDLDIELLINRIGQF